MDRQQMGRQTTEWTDSRCVNRMDRMDRQQMGRQTTDWTDSRMDGQREGQMDRHQMDG